MAASTITSASGSDVDDPDMPNQAATLVRSISITAFIMLFGVGIPLSLFMDSWLGGMGVGAFTALWGGPGFGLMAGMALHTLHMENWEKQHSH